MQLRIQVDTVVYILHEGEPWRDRFKSALKRCKETGSCVTRQRQSQRIAGRFPRYWLRIMALMPIGLGSYSVRVVGLFFVAVSIFAIRTTLQKTYGVVAGIVL